MSHTENARVEQDFFEVAEFFSHISKACIKELSYGRAYTAMYRAITNGYGYVVYYMARGTLRRLSLCTTKNEFDERAQIICSVLLFLNGFIKKHKLCTVEECAKSAFDRPVARRWRHVANVVKKLGLIIAVRPAFDEVQFRPGGIGARNAELHFFGAANLQNGHSS